MKGDTDLALARLFIAAHPADAARVVERHSVSESCELLAELTAAESALVLEQMAAASAAACLGALPAASAGGILAELAIDRAAALLRVVPDEAAKLILDAAPSPVFASALRLLVAYPEGSAGALLDPTALAVPGTVEAKDAVELVLRQASHALHYVYVVDRRNRLVGVLSLRELMLAAPEKPLAAAMHKDISCLRSDADVVEILAHPGWREHHSLPVVDQSGAFLGAIRYRTLRLLERTGSDGALQGSALEAALSLGELYWFGLSRVLEGITTAALSREATAGARDGT